MFSHLTILFLKLLGCRSEHTIRSILGFAWIIAVIIATSGIITGFALSIFGLTEQLGYSNRFSIRPIDPDQEISREIVEKLYQGDFVEILPLAKRMANFSSKGMVLQTNLIGTNLTALTRLFTSSRIVEGRIPKTNQTPIECLQGMEVSGYLTSDISYLIHKENLYEMSDVVGTITGVAELQQTIMVDLEDFAKIIDESLTKLNYSEVKIKTKGTFTLKNVEKTLRELLNNKYREIMVWNEQQADVFSETLIKDIFSKLELLFIVLLIIALARLFHSISWFVTTFERTFLIMRAIGLSKEKLFVLMMILGQVVGNMGFVLGVIIGYSLPPLALSMLTTFFGVGFLVTEFPLTSIIPLWLVSVIITTLATIAPGLKMSSTPPAKISILINKR